MHARRLLSFLFICGLSACGGGSSPDGKSSSAFSVSTSGDSGITFTPASISVEQGKIATFAVTFKPGYGVKELSGCGGALSGGTYTTAAIVANCTVTGTSKVALALNTMRLSPHALFNDEFATTPVLFEASVSNAKGLHLFLEYSTIWFDRNAVPGQGQFPLFDDGTHGDRIAGDGIHSATIVTGMIPRLRYYDRTADRLPISFVAYDDAGNALLLANAIVPNVQLGVVARSMAVAPVNRGDGIFTSPNVVNIVMPDPATKALAAVQKLYQYYPDVFDGYALHLIGVTADINIAHGGAIKNEAKGTNLGLYDNSLGYGSKGVLANGVYMAGDIVGEVFLHELGHANMFFLNNKALDLTSGTVVHIGITTLLGQMGNAGFLQEQSSGDFMVWNAPDGGQYSHRPFANLELYLMGLLPPQYVEPDYFITDPTVNVTPGVVIPRAKATRVTIDDVIRVYGPRTPTTATSQKSFRFAFIALSEKQASPAEIALVNRVAAFYEGATAGGEVDMLGQFPTYTPPSFMAATKGLGELITRLPNPK